MMRPDILTSRGCYFNFITPEDSSIFIDDIANGLSNICRFNGQCKEFYSVAQHSVLVSQLVPNEHALQALLHDAAEAYVGDMTAPLKRLIPEYKVIEERVHKAIFQHFDLNPELPGCIKEADLIMLATEQRDLMPSHDDEWAIIKRYLPLEQAIKPLLPLDARLLFLNRWYELLA